MAADKDGLMDSVHAAQRKKMKELWDNKEDWAWELVSRPPRLEKE